MLVKNITHYSSKVMLSLTETLSSLVTMIQSTTQFTSSTNCSSINTSTIYHLCLTSNDPTIISSFNPTKYPILSPTINPTFIPTMINKNILLFLLLTFANDEYDGLINGSFKPLEMASKIS